MNTFTKVLTTLTVSLSCTAMANTSDLVAMNDSITTELCMTAASDNRPALRTAIKNSGLSKSYVVYNVKCNDKNITDFVAQHGKAPEKMNAILNRGLKKPRVSINDIASL